MDQGWFRAIGLMSGTSMDGIDVGALETDGTTIGWKGPAVTLPYPADLRNRLAKALRNPEGDHSGLETELTDRHIAAVRQYVSALPADKHAIHVIGFHGQTIVHRPERRYTRQLGDGERLARALGIDTVFDFRSADLAAGGEGAPLAPVYHQALAAGLAQPVIFVNIGGVSNVTYINADELIAFDTGPGNALIDDWVLARAGLGYDKNGAIAAHGRVDETRLARLLDNRYFDRKPPKSLDRLDFSAAPVEGLSAEDGAATLTAFTAEAIARARAHLPGEPKRWLVTGGGRHNPTLMTALAARVPGEVVPVEAIGADGDGLEAEAFAFMAVRTLLGLPISFPGTTGAPAPMPGGRIARAAKAA